MLRTSPIRPASMNAAQGWLAEAGRTWVPVWPNLGGPVFDMCVVVVQAPLLDPFGRACFAAVCTDLGILLPCYPDGAQLTASALLTRKL